MFGSMRFFRRRSEHAAPTGPILFRKVAIIGVGLVGGSLAKALKKQQLVREVAGFSQRPTSLEWALKNGVIDSGHQDVRKAVHDADLVVLATPVSIISSMIMTIGPHLRRGAIVTDVGSTKSSIVDAARECLPSSVFFVGSHPLAGSEKTGVENCNEELFKGSVCVMTPTDQTHKVAVERVKRLWARLGANVKFLSPDEHDKILAHVSHLPHILAYSLIQTIPLSYLEYGGQGLKDTTRIAGSSAQMWSDICMANSKNIINVIDALVKNLSAVRKAVNTNDHKMLMSQFKDAQVKRESLKP